MDKDGPEELKLHFRKIFYTLKLQEMLLSQLGYFGGSLEFKAGMENDLEYWVYLLSTKTRNPEQQMTEPAPKPMEPYRTSEESLLPWNNQFSISVGHAEFNDVNSIPAKDRADLERKLDEFQAARHDGRRAHGRDLERGCESRVQDRPR